MARRTQVIDLTRAVRIFLVAAIFFSIVVFDRGSLKPFDVVKITVLWALGWMAFGLWLIEVVRGRARIAGSLMTYLALALLVVTGLATVLSQTPWVSFVGSYARYNGFVTTLLFVALFILIANLYRGRPDWVRDLLYAVAAGSVVVVVYIGLQWLGLDPVNWSTVEGKPAGLPFYGTMGNANFAGGLLGLSSPWLYYAFRQAGSPLRRGAVIAWGAAHLGALWLTSTRSGMFALVVAVGMIALVHRRSLPAWLKVTGATAAAAIALVALLVLWHPGMDRPPGPLREPRVLRSATIRVRAHWWLAAVGIVADRPILGAGPETYVTVYPQHLSRDAAPLNESETADKPHNVFLEYAAGTGLLGLGAYLALVSVGLSRAFRRLRDVEGQEEALIATLLAIFAGYMGQAFFSIDVAPLGMAGWAALAGIAALADPPLGARRFEGVTPQAARAVAMVGVAVLIAGTVFVGAFPLRADHAARAGTRAVGEQASVGEVSDEFEEAMSLHPFEPLYRGIAGDYLQRRATATESVDEKRALLEEAVVLFEEMDRLQPGRHLWKMTIGKAVGELAAANGDASFEEAERWFEEAAVLGPYDWRVPAAYGELLEIWARAADDREMHCDALEQFKKANKLRRSEAGPWIGLAQSYLAIGDLKQARFSAVKARDADPESESAREVLRQTREADKRPVVRCE